MTQHLNPEQFYSLLDPYQAPDQAPDQAADQASNLAQQHLLACPECRVQLDAVRASLSNFQLAATRLSLAQAPTRLLHPGNSKSRLVTLPRAAWASGLVAAMALGTVSLSMLHKPAATPAPVAHTVSAAPQTEAQADDALLNGIDSDLSTAVPPSLQPLEATSVSEKTSSSSSN